MSAVPAKTSTRPSGFTLIQHCEGSPFWFMPVGYSIAAMPRPVRFAMSVTLRGSDLGDEMLGEQVAGPGLVRHRAVVRWQLVADRVGEGFERVDGRRIGVGDPVRRRVADTVRVLHADLDRIDAELVRDSVQVRLHGERDGRDAESTHRRGR